MLSIENKPITEIDQKLIKQAHTLSYNIIMYLINVVFRFDFFFCFPKLII